ncbi:MAG: hypothetical protein KGI27_05420 [Thaumarchaeota archaeon]|nr:hypothetical protein [Nitrososphaerota archaeon]
MTGTKPKVIITDDLRSYADAYDKEFFTQKDSSHKTNHIARRESRLPILDLYAKSRWILIMIMN